MLIAEMTKRTVRTELVEVHSIASSNRGDGISGLSAKCPSSVRKCAALPFDRLRANGSISDSELEKFVVIWPIC